MARPLPISTDADLNRIDLQLARSHLEVTGADLETCSGGRVRSARGQTAGRLLDCHGTQPFSQLRRPFSRILTALRLYRVDSRGWLGPIDDCEQSTSWRTRLAATLPSPEPTRSQRPISPPASVNLRRWS